MKFAVVPRMAAALPAKQGLSGGLFIFPSLLERRTGPRYRPGAAGQVRAPDMMALNLIRVPASYLKSRDGGSWPIGTSEFSSK
jgi:hypothetical protein